VFHILGFLIFGFVVGLVARALMPGPQPMGFLRTAFLGVTGSFVGGVLASVLYGGPLFGPVYPAHFFGSVIGAVVVLFGVGAARRHRLLE
jgi:uncharacterized membrane protein YeaQ/YmgE (transglycosylase-associated protein family)